MVAAASTPAVKMTRSTTLDDLTVSDYEQWSSTNNTMYVQERAFVNWCNLVLRKKGFQIKSILDLEDGVCLLCMLKCISLHRAYIDGDVSPDDVESNWRTILKVLEGEGIQVTESPGKFNFYSTHR